MILGIGTDIVSINRVQDSIERFGDDFVRRLLSDAEYAVYETTRQKVEYMAGRFAVKEAFFKAIGTGVRDGLAFKQASTINDDLGKPVLTPLAEAKIKCDELGVKQFDVSISHEKDYAIAFVVLS